MPSDRDSAYHNMFDMAVAIANGGVNLDTAAETVQMSLEALKKQAEALKLGEYTATKEKRVSCPECAHTFSVPMPAHAELSKTMANTAKVIDETARLIQYTNGKPDSRPEMVGHEWLQALTPEQLSQVQTWIHDRASHP